MSYEGDGVWVGVPPPQEPITYSVGDLEGITSLNGSSTWVDWANDFTPVVHERLVGFGQFAAEHEGATKLLSFAAETVSYALMGWMRAGLSIATEAVLGAAKSQVRDYAIERVGDYYQSKGVSTDNAGILASGTVFGAEVAIGEVGAAVKGAQRYAMRMDGASGEKGIGNIPAKNITIDGGPYSNLMDSPSVGPGKNFTRTQKAKIYQQNMDRNNGVLRSDLDGQELVFPQKSQAGVTPPSNEAQIDHIVPRKPADPDAPVGTNSYSNGQILSREQNRQKSNN